MNTQSTNRAPKGCRVSTYKYVGIYGRYGIAEAAVIDQNGRTAARIYHGPQGYQAETPAMSYATEWHPTEAAALAALFASGEWAYFGPAATKQHQPDQLRELGPLAALFGWMDQHPRTASALLWLQVVALIWAVFAYDFTIPMYK